MPPKRRGRPPGSKNKKSKKDDVDKIESESETKVKENIEAKLHVKKAVISCKECNKKFTLEKNFKLHLLLEHSKTPGSVQCNQCSVCCPNKEVLEEHIEKYHKRDIFECKFCKKQFVRYAHVLRHLSQKGCDGNGVTSYPCEICNISFSRHDNLIVHLRSQHIATKQFSCKLCEYSTGNFSKLVNHSRTHLENPKVFECHHCGKTAGSRAAITKHMEIHGEKKYSCDKCEYRTYTIEVMRRHMFTHESDKPFKCSICFSSFIQSAQLERHLEKHTGNMCLVCGQTFPSKAKLMLHQRAHMGLDQLYCPIKKCSYSKKPFATEEAMNYHVNTYHFRVKEYKCNVCDKSFHSPLLKKRHMLSHMLERPRRCMYCVHARAYVRGEQLVKHVRKSHQRVFQGHLEHVREVLGSSHRGSGGRVTKSEIESILDLLDAESERILEGYGSGVLYGGLQEDSNTEDTNAEILPILNLNTADLLSVKTEECPLMSEAELAESLGKLLTQLVDKETLECFGWPEESVDVVLEKLIEQCGARAADRERWSRVQRLRENTKQMFLYVVDDKNVTRVLDTHPIDQIVTHILRTVSS